MKILIGRSKVPSSVSRKLLIGSLRSEPMKISKDVLIKENFKHMKLLDKRQIEQKIKRLSIEILEHNFDEETIILAGINNRGMVVAEELFRLLTDISDKKVTLTRIRLSPANPLESPVEIDLPLNDFRDKAIIIVDDVANTGRTLFYAIAPLLDILPKKIEIAVLVDRKHKLFPINVDYVGLSLFTTLKENIDVRILEGEEHAVYLT